MVKTATSFGKSGLQDWLFQRVTALILGVYLLFLVVYFFNHPEFNYRDWKNLFMHPGIRYFSILSLLSLMIHAWIGVWTMTTDYIKPVVMRLFVQLFFVLALVVYLIWGIQIVWSV